MSKLWLKMVGTSEHPWDVEKPWGREYMSFRGCKK